MVVYKKIIVRLSVLLFFVCGCSVFSMNITRPYEALVQPVYRIPYTVALSVLGQAAIGDAKGYNEEGCRVNVLRIWNEDQNALKMLDGFNAESDIGQRRIKVGANDDGVRGHFLVDGDLVAHGVAFSCRWSLPKNFSLVAYVPFQFMRLKNVKWCEQTKNVTADDIRTKQNLTDDFFDNVCQLGGLALGDWSRSGFGDTTLLFSWLQDFRQTKPYLKNVRINARAGFKVPTGKRRDEDKIFALPFGNDGSVGGLFGGGIDLTFGSHVRAGIDVELQHFFGNTRCRRIKTHIDQTELLLLQKSAAFKDFGLSQRFSLYTQLYRLWDRFSCTVGYQFYRHGDDTLILSDHEFCNTVANTANSLQEWTMHNLFLDLRYDVNSEHDDSRVHPYVAVFAKIPFNGKFSALVNTVGVVLSIDF